MPTYSFLCNRCGTEFDRVKRVNDRDEPESCDCGMRAERVLRFNGHMAPENWIPYFNHGLGKVVRSKNDIRNEIARVKGEEGRELIEVGNEEVKVKKKKTEYDMEAIAQDYKKALKH